MGREPRRLTLLDLIALIPAFALSLAVVSWFRPGLDWPGTAARLWRQNARHGPVIGSMACAWNAADLLLPAAPVLGVALLGLRLRHPRPRRWRALCSQPGSMACLAIAASVPLSLAIAYATKWDFAEYFVPARLHPNLELIGLMVLISWATLALAGRWRPERSWLDRSGRALGVAVIAGATCRFLMKIIV